MPCSLIDAAKDAVHEWIRTHDPPLDRELVVLATSGEFPSNGLGVRPDMYDSLKVKLESALEHLHYGPQGLTVLAKLRSKRFIETRVENCRPVFDAASKADFDITTFVSLNDGSLARACSDTRKVTRTRARPASHVSARANRLKLARCPGPTCTGPGAERRLSPIVSPAAGNCPDIIAQLSGPRRGFTGLPGSLKDTDQGRSRREKHG